MKQGNEAVAAAQGQEIDWVDLGDKVLKLVLRSGSLFFEDAKQTCREHRYMTTDDTLADFVGALFLGCEVKQAPNVSTADEGHEVEFLEIKTSRGSFTIANHNEHNGYYGGFDLSVAWNGP